MINTTYLNFPKLVCCPWLIIEPNPGIFTFIKPPHLTSIPLKVINQIFILQHIFNPAPNWPYPDIKVLWFSFVRCWYRLLFKLEQYTVSKSTICMESITLPWEAAVMQLSGSHTFPYGLKVWMIPLYHWYISWKDESACWRLSLMPLHAA